MDLGAELGISPSAATWITIRVQLVVASAAAGLPAPIGPVDADFQDLDRLRRETRLLYDIGYRSRAAIHRPKFQSSARPWSRAKRRSPGRMTSWKRTRQQ